MISSRTVVPPSGISTGPFGATPVGEVRRQEEVGGGSYLYEDAHGKKSDWQQTGFDRT